MNQSRKTTNPEMNPDPITGASGSHGVGTGIGAAVGGVAGIGGAIATGAMIGTAAGPIGTAAGAVVGAVIGGLAGKQIAEDVNPSIEDKYWREIYTTRPYAANKSYDDYGPAYRYGWEAYGKHGGKRFDDVESYLQQNWDGNKGQSQLVWFNARPAARDAWDRVEARHAAGKHQNE